MTPNNRYGATATTASALPQNLFMSRDQGSMAELEIRSMVDMAKVNIKQFYEMYDSKMKDRLTHPLFEGIDEAGPKLQVLTEQVELLESEMARRIRDLVWA